MKFSGESGKFAVKKYKTEHFNLTEMLYPPRLKQPRHTHSSASFSFVLSGNYLENFGKRLHSRQSSTMIFHPPQEAHSVEYGIKAVRILNVEFGFEKLAYIQSQTVVLDSSTSLRTKTIAWLGSRVYQEFQRMDAVSTLAIEGLVLEILAEVSRYRTGANEKNMPYWLAEAKDFLNAHFAENFTLEDVARISGVHPVHLARVFRQKFGCTIGEYVRQLRVEFAARQISLTHLPFSEIAQTAGFADQSHLNKTFKNLYGLTPSAYRRITHRS